MMRAAREAADEEAAKVLQSPPLVIAVTVLTSIGEATLADLGVAESLGDHVVRLATLAQSAALDGVVASPREIALIRAQCGERFAIVTPGIRGLADLKGDQTRTESVQAASRPAPASLSSDGQSLRRGSPCGREAIAEECRSVTPTLVVRPLTLDLRYTAKDTTKD
jgi:orotidine-5'-phosphate decarboxylase